jgi:hypothetical protein
LARFVEIEIKQVKHHSMHFPSHLLAVDDQVSATHDADLLVRGEEYSWNANCKVILDNVLEQGEMATPMLAVLVCAV